MNEILDALDKHFWAVFTFGWLLYLMIVGIIRALKE